MPDLTPPLVSMRGISKKFYENYANKDVDFDLLHGEVHSLLGENGAGKTTLMNILAGLYSPDEGRIEIEGKPVKFRTPKDAIRAQIGMVHQHFMLVPVMTVWENMILGMDDTPFLIPKIKIIARIKELCEQYALSVSPEAKIWQLSIGEQQRVEILKMLYRGSRILIMDEPTAVLTPQDAKDLFVTVRKMTSEGHGVIFISHKMEEVLAISDRLSVLRKGQKIDTVSSEGVTKDRLAELMVGHSVSGEGFFKEDIKKDVVMECKNIKVINSRNVEALKDVSLELRRGEILGVAGVAGNGQQELCEVLAGLIKPQDGYVSLNGHGMSARSARDFLDNKISYIPADRKGMGLVANMNIRENIALKYYRKGDANKWHIFLNWEYVAGFTGVLVERYGVKCPSLGSPARVLSGGNLQKLMLARELASDPQVVLAMQPTWGLDVGAARFVHEKLTAARNSGAAVLVVSEDLDEILTLSDRIIVLYKGTISGKVDDIPQAASNLNETIGLMMAGVAVN